VKFCDLSDDNRQILETALESMQPSVVAQK
jgi:hypothetical protein